MMRDKVFAFDSYKKIMRHYLMGEGNRGQLSRAADHLGVQRSYLSRVMAEKLQLTPDHAFNLAGFWRLTEGERDYFLALVEWERATDQTYRNHVKGRIIQLKQKYDSVGERTQRSTLSISAHQVSYFSSWAWSAIHFLTSIPEFQTAEAIARRLGLSHELTLLHLRELESQGFVVKNAKGGWRYQSGEFHAPKDSPLVLFHHQNWRTRAVLDAQDFTRDSVHYTAVQTLSQEDFAKLREKLLEFIAETSRISGPSEPEECLALTCDLFRI